MTTDKDEQQAYRDACEDKQRDIVDGLGKFREKWLKSLNHLLTAKSQMRISGRNAVAELSHRVLMADIELENAFRQSTELAWFQPKELEDIFQATASHLVMVCCQLTCKDISEEQMDKVLEAQGRLERFNDEKSYRTAMDSMDKAFRPKR